MLTVETQLIEDRQARLIVSVDSERVEKAMHEAARRIARKINIPGFRRGHAPYHIVTRYVGEGALLEEALDPLGQSVYAEALEQSGLEPYAPGALTDLKRDPFEMTFTVPLRPEVDLGNYRDLRVPFEALPVTDEEVDRSLRALREEHATLEPVDRPIALGDVATMDIRGVIERMVHAGAEEPHDHTLIDREGVRVLITEESTYPVPGFPAQVVGMEAGSTREFQLVMPDESDYDEEVRGQTIAFTVRCREVFSREAPEINDELAHTAGDYENLDQLRAGLRKNLEEAALRQAESDYADRALEALLPSARVSFPPIMVEEQIDSLLEDFDRRLREQGLTFEDYLRMSQRSRDDMREEFRPAARRSVMRALVLGKLIENEALAISESEIDDEIENMLLAFGTQAGVARQLLKGRDARRSISSRLLVDKARQRLVAIARGEAPPLENSDALPETAAAQEMVQKPKTRRSKKEPVPSATPEAD